MSRVASSPTALRFTRSCLVKQGEPGGVNPGVNYAGVSAGGLSGLLGSLLGATGLEDWRNSSKVLKDTTDYVTLAKRNTQQNVKQVRPV